MHPAAHRLHRHRRDRAGGGNSNPKRKWLDRVWRLVDIFFRAGGRVAAWQVYLQQLPPGQVPECGPGLDYMLEAMPLTKILPLILKVRASAPK